MGTVFNIHGVVCYVVLVGVVKWVVPSFGYVKRRENEMSSTFQFNEFLKLQTEMMKMLLVQFQRVRVNECIRAMQNLVKLRRIRAQVTCTDILGQRTGFSCTLTNVGFVVDKAALRHVILDRFSFPLFIIFTPMLCTH